jgi:hypothetical protein
MLNAYTVTKLNTLRKNKKFHIKNSQFTSFESPVPYLDFDICKVEVLGFLTTSADFLTSISKQLQNSYTHKTITAI